ncbi:DUF6478 family protein [Roseovarius salinarum]|uniref:DUF6478 family protein n=1 Tax=Roseovarius salinarum TaxID=1981892 RepID=UPI000C3341EE|nr:DUF6478 family protein [Roseovarius salinarum]
MLGRVNRILDAIHHRRSLRRWTRVSRRARDMPLPRLRVEEERARQLWQRLNETLHVAGERLALPHIGSNAFPKPQGTTWAWRPALWRGPLDRPGMSSVENNSGLGDEVILFHDCAKSELTLRQLRNQREADLAPYGLRLDVFAFDGSFLSLVVHLPEAAVDGLRKQDLIRMNTIVEMEKPLEIFARLNVKHGPNTEQIVRELPLHQDDITVEFDLAYTKLNEKRVERAWVDLIFENPQMNQVVLRDLTFCRHPRAEI